MTIGEIAAEVAKENRGKTAAGCDTVNPPIVVAGVNGLASS